MEQAVLGMHVWVRGSEWVMMAESRTVPGMRVMTRKAASSQMRPKVGEFVLLEVMSLQVQALGLQLFPQKAQPKSRGPKTQNC